MRKLGYVLILLGVVVILYPQLSEWNAVRQTSQLLMEAEEQVSDKGTTTTEQSKTTGQANQGIANEYANLTKLLEHTSESEQTSRQRKVFNPSEKKAATTNEEAIGIIEIKDIEVKLPILEGATQQNMKHAAVHMSETASLGQPGNAAIAAHRAHAKGRLFNRLDEVKLGDEVLIRTQGEQYRYEIIRIKMVEPTDLSVLQGEGDDCLLTLITCDPLINPTHRLIVQAKIMN
ncbi:class D sortase [Paenibacillus sp. ACRRY]|uniref:class D sortase n=1 Tax=Paenibacillus sp. ACRRY TaxID=2918208 RepID=UPI001EF6DB6B|nr:class D sortase [Paenibacillus sp. ACRRY]MCG7384427.1 class D sortase [Paenibacillus sp. ACRRY]